eukprot:759523-Hanusia_phi.AAC.5
MQAVSVKVNSRKRVDIPGTSTRPVEITLDRLRPLFHLRQEIAAEILGVSLSSLKTSCRRLGLNRWPYTRFNSNEGGSFIKVLVENSTTTTLQTEAVNEGQITRVHLEEAFQPQACQSTPSSSYAIVDEDILLDPEWILWYISLDDTDAEDV